jgi:hypothetical protein
MEKLRLFVSALQHGKHIHMYTYIGPWLVLYIRLFVCWKQPSLYGREK